MPRDQIVPWTLRPDSLELRVTPRGGRDALDGVAVLADGRAVLRARVPAAPEDGAANAAVGDLVHAVLRRVGPCPREAVTLAADAAGRMKTLRIAALAAIEARAEGKAA